MRENRKPLPAALALLTVLTLSHARSGTHPPHSRSRMTPTAGDDARRLMGCATSDGRLVTEDGVQGDDAHRYNVSELLSLGISNPSARLEFARGRRRERDGSDVSHRHHHHRQHHHHRTMEVKSRRKRAWTFPGTLWCGVGSKATRYDQLGMFESADRCCREHDHCEHIIPAFTVNYGVFNPNFFTISHCDCDQRFRQCLLGVNETISAMVGFSFFNIFKVPCFELVQRMQCTEMYWWGMCKETKEAPYAVFQNPAAFNTTHTPSKHNDAGESHMRATAEGDRVVAVPPSHSNRKPSKAEISKQSGSSHRCTLRDPPRGDTFHRKKRKGLGCKRSRITSTAAPTEMPTAPMAHTAVSSTLRSAFLMQKTTQIISELKTTLKKVSKISTTISNRKRLRKKKGTRMELIAYPTHESQVPSQATMKSYTPSTTQSTPPITQRAAVNQQATIAMVTEMTTRSHKKCQKKRRCRGPRLRGNAPQSRRKPCSEQKNTSCTPVFIPSTVTTALPYQGTPALTQGPRNTTVSPEEETSAGPWTTDSLLLCGTLKHLDECRYKIPPLKKKYHLRNMESKTIYHCDCTSRLAGLVESFNKPSILPSLLNNFVSQYCITLTTMGKCHSRKSCTAALSKASDLLQALKKLKKKDTDGAQNSSKEAKRRAPICLYRHCLNRAEPREKS